MAVLVAHASAHGSTEQIAGRIAARLCEQGLDAVSRPVADVTELTGFGAFVIGSAIHGGDWLPSGASFLAGNAGALAGQPVWLFSVSSIGEGSSAFPGVVERQMQTVTRPPRAVTAVSPDLQPRDHHAFAGVVSTARWGLAGRIFLYTFGGRSGDHLNWQEIDAWAMRIAGELRPGRRPG
ncbi:MAG TPA: flavodoxin domain-containing protein [Streptosporangiaceae bacterium]